MNISHLPLFPVVPSPHRPLSSHFSLLAPDILPNTLSMCSPFLLHSHTITELHILRCATGAGRNVLHRLLADVYWNRTVVIPSWMQFGFVTIAHKFLNFVAFSYDLLPLAVLPLFLHHLHDTQTKACTLFPHHSLADPPLYWRLTTSAVIFGVPKASFSHHLQWSS